MAVFGQKSQENLLECDDRLQHLFNEVIKDFDCTILVGYRDEAAQNDAFDQGLSKLRYPNSKHNVQPSLAVDAAPFPLNWNDTQGFYYFAGFVMGVAKRLGIPLRYGGDWNRNNQVKDEHFRDLVHFELED